MACFINVCLGWVNSSKAFNHSLVYSSYQVLFGYFATPLAIVYTFPPIINLISYGTITNFAHDESKICLDRDIGWRMAACMKCFVVAIPV